MTQDNTHKNVSEEELEETVEELEHIQEEQGPQEAGSPLAGITQELFEDLTNRNQQFLVNLDRHLAGEVDYEVRSRVYNEMAETLLDGQTSGQTARQLYGTPSEVAKGLLEKNLKAQKEIELGERSPDWQIALDGSLLLGSLYMVMTGFSLMRTQQETVYNTMGIFSVLISYIVAGFAMLYTSKAMPDPDGPKGQKGYPKYFLVSITSVAVWFLAVSLSGALLPPSINIILPPIAYMIIGAVTLVARFVLKKMWNIRGGIL